MREGWKQVLLGEVAQTVSATLKPGAREDLPYVALEHVIPGNPRVPVYGKSSDTVSVTTVFQPGDVLFSKLRPYLNKVVVAESEGCCTTEILVWRTSDEKALLPAFMALVLRDQRAIQHAVDMSAGSRMPRTSVSQMNEFKFLLPPLEEQQRIVDLIGSLDDAIEAADAAGQATRQTMEGLRKHALTAVPTASSNLGDFVEFASGYSFPLSFQGAASGDYPFYKVSDMNAPGNEHKMTVAKNWITEQDKQQIRCRLWPAGTVIFPKVGAALATEKRRMLDRPAVFDNNLMGLVAGPLLSSGYLFMFMEEVVLGAVAQVGPVPSINQSHIKSLKIAVPPLEEQLAAVEIVDQARDAAGKAESYAASLRSTRSELLTVLLSGEHEIPESYDGDTAVQLEPAA